MGQQFRYLPYAANLNTAAGTSLWINEIESTGDDAGVKLLELAAGSEVDRMFVAANSIEPKFKLDTYDLSVATTIGMSGALINCGSSAPGFSAWGRYFLTGGVPVAIATADHILMNITDGMIVPASMRASHGSPGKLSLMVHAILGTTASYSGATPIVFTNASAITAGATATAKAYTVGPVKYDSNFLQGIQDISVNFGIDVWVKGSDGNPYPSFVGIDYRAASIEFTTFDYGLRATIGDIYALSSSFAVYFQQYLTNGTRVPAATTTHIKVSGTTGAITPAAGTLAHKAEGKLTFRYTPTGTTQLAIAAAAIPTS